MKTNACFIHAIISGSRASIAALLLISSLNSHLSSSAHAQGGSLTPPPGAPGPVMKSLAQIEPRTDLANVAGDASNHHVITASGSYFLSGNLDVTKTNGISIQATQVTLDLGGFSIRRTSGAGGIGIQIVPAAEHCAVKNGFVAGFAVGVGPQTSPDEFLAADYGVLEKLAVTGCSFKGLCGRHHWRITDCHARKNSGPEVVGIQVQDGSILTGCTAADNTGATAFIGIAVGQGSVLADCAATSNKATAGYCRGITAGSGTTLRNCTASSNSAPAGACVGILVASNSTVVGCSATENSSSGAVCIGIDAGNGSGSTLVDCTVGYNTAQGSTVVGLKLSNGCTVSNCTAKDHTGSNPADPSLSGVGIQALNGMCSVSGCTVANSSGDGIRIGANSSVRDCLVDLNSAAGIHVTGEGARIEGNILADNLTGLKVDSARCLILGNSAYGNTTAWNIAAGNKVGPIVIAPASAAINGSTGGSGVGSTDPAANFTY